MGRTSQLTHACTACGILVWYYANAEPTGTLHSDCIAEFRSYMSVRRHRLRNMWWCYGHNPITDAHNMALWIDDSVKGC